MRHNLNPESAPWANDIDRRLNNLERTHGFTYGVAPGDMRQSVISRRSAPTVHTHTANLPAPADKKVYQWTTPIPAGATMGYITPPFPSSFGISTSSATGNMWWLFLGDPEVDWMGDADLMNSPDSLTQVHLFAPFGGGSWEVVPDITQKGALIDTAGKTDFEISVWSVAPNSPTNTEFLRVDFTYAIMWSFEGSRQWVQ